MKAQKGENQQTKTQKLNPFALRNRPQETSVPNGESSTGSQCTTLQNLGLHIPFPRCVDWRSNLFWPRTLPPEIEMKKLLQKAVKEELDKQAASNLLLCTYRSRTFWKYVVSQPLISKLWLEDVVPMRHTCSSHVRVVGLAFSFKLRFVSP